MQHNAIKKKPTIICERHKPFSSPGLTSVFISDFSLWKVITLGQWFQTLDDKMFLDYEPQKSSPIQIVMKASGNCSPRIFGDPKLGTADLEQQKCVA